MKFGSCGLTILTLAYGCSTTAAGAGAAQLIPTSYQTGHFYALPETRDGQQLKLLVDTGGPGGSGLYVLKATTVQRLHLPSRQCLLGHEAITVAQLPEFRAGRGLPSPSGPCGAVALVVPSVDDDGALGAGYLPGHVWTFDYPARTLSVESSSWRPDLSVPAVALGFPLDAHGRATSGFPRIVIRVDNQPLDMLLDTGATAHPTIAGEKASGTPTQNGIGVASYITTSMLERWHKAHPDWPVVEAGDDLLRPTRSSRLIEAPAVQIAGWSVGPVWFTERPDANLHDVSSYMDKQVEGALGANVLQHFVMTLDYPHRMAYFRCASGCRATPPPAP